MKKIFIFALIVLVLGAAAYGAWCWKYPYGYTHRCSKSLAMELQFYPDDHNGKYPRAERPDQLGLDVLLGGRGTSDFIFELIVGKAGNLKEAQKFYNEHGYLRKEHSSWHYVSGLSLDDKGRAIAWDKIPLNHNGGREDAKPREVIMVGGAVRVVTGDNWEGFLQQQRELTDMK